MNSINRENLYVIAGPTASGKSSYAIDFAKKIGGVIVNADSRQIYNEMKIGTAQPIPDSVEKGFWIIDGIKHYLYGHREITSDYTVVDYQKEVYELASRLNEPIILVGGTGLFIDSVVYDYKFDRSESSNSEFNREELEAMELSKLQDLITQTDLKKLNDSDRNNPRRLIRVIENGLPKKQEKKHFEHYIVIDPGREKLIQNIIGRTNRMFKSGLEKEVKTLWEKYPNFPYKALQSIGYTEFIPYFNDECDLKEVEENIIIHTRQYAKRQRSWFRRS